MTDRESTAAAAGERHRAWIGAGASERVIDAIEHAGHQDLTGLEREAGSLAELEEA